MAAQCPKRPSAEVLFKHPNHSGEDLPPNVWCITALIMGIAGLMLRNKMMAWGALFASVITWTNLRFSRADWKQLITMSLFCVMGIVLNYYTPGGQQAAPSPSP